MCTSASATSVSASAPYIQVDESCLNKDQKKICSAIKKYGCIYITGYPGCGKTFLASCLTAKRSYSMLILCSTGIATTLLPGSMTIHRAYYSNIIHRYDIIIIEEVSMVSPLMLYMVISKAIKCKQLIFVGDHNQLFPVGLTLYYNKVSHFSRSAIIPLISSSVNFVHMIKLRKNMRNKLSTKLFDSVSLDGIVPESNNIILVNIDVMKAWNMLRQRYNDDSIIIICPFRKMAEEYNDKICNQLFGENIGLGIRIQLTKNNYRLRYFNGNIGKLVSLNPIKVEIGDRIITPHNNEWKRACSITTHGSQGNEFKFVIFVLPDKDHKIMTRNLVYVAITRSKELCVIVGKKAILDIACNKTVEHRSLLEIL